MYNSLNQSKINLKDFYTKYKNCLEKIKKEIENELIYLNKTLEVLNNNSEKVTNNEDIFSLSFEEYKKISDISNKMKKINFVKTFSDLLNEVKTKQKQNIQNEKMIKNVPKDFKIISEEVKVIKNSKTYDNYSTEILFGRSSIQFYCLFDGTKNHFLELDLGKYYYLKTIKMKVDNFECINKNFKVSIKNQNGLWEKSKEYLSQKYNSNIEFQDFEIGKETQYIRLDFYDNWGSVGGNYIIIKRLKFEVGDL